MDDLATITSTDGFNPTVGSPLSGKKAVEHPVSLRQAEFEEKAVVRGDFGDGAFVESVQNLLSVALPDRVGDISQGEHCSVICLGPDEWLVVETAGANTLLSASRDHPNLKQIVVSDYYCGLDLSGDLATHVLQKVVAIDFDEPNVPVGTCVQTALHNVPVIIWRQADACSYRIYVRWSLAEYVWDLLADLVQSEG